MQTLFTAFAKLSILGRLTLVLSLFFIAENLLLLQVGSGLIARDYASSQQFHMHDSARSIASQMQAALDNEQAFEEVERLAYEFNLLNPRIRQYLLDDSGKVIHAFLGHVSGRETGIDLAPVEAFLSGAALPLFCQDPRDVQKKVAFSAAPLRQKTATWILLHVFPSSPLETLSASSLHFLRTSGALFVLGIFALGSVLLALLLATSVTAPISNLRAAAKRIAGGEYASRAPERGAKEVRELARYFNEMSAEIELKIDQLHHEDQLRRELVGGLSHDLSAPAGVIVACAEFLIQGEGRTEGVPRREEYIESMIRNAQSIQLLTEDLLQLSKLGSTELCLACTELRVDELLADVVAAFRPIADARSIELRVENDAAQVFIWGDLVLLGRVLSNLLGNALRHTPDAGRIIVRAETVKDMVLFQVEDSGSGISPEDISKIFEPYYQGKSAHAGVMGLGLAICRRILEAHGTKLQVSSVLGKGAVFSFSLPVLEAQNA